MLALGFMHVFLMRAMVAVVVVVVEVLCWFVVSEIRSSLSRRIAYHA